MVRPRLLLISTGNLTVGQAYTISKADEWVHPLLLFIEDRLHPFLQFTLSSEYL